ncbi:GWxTD domain-containing protein [Flavobacteriales bacterium AH-315-E23]|nr:GWxTD domain-containing protein [Flavobacteriales bacterium AH-315-E23]
MNTKLSLIAVLVCALACTGVGQSLEAFYSKAFFLHPEGGPYVETYLAINGNSVIYKKNEKGELQGKVEVTVIYLQKDSIKYFDKYEVRSPILLSDKTNKPNFLDIQRVALPNGVYQFEMKIVDLNGDEKSKAFSHNDVIVLDFKDDSVSISDIELVESFQRTEERDNFVKGGVKLIPYTSNFYPADVSTMIFYAEIYNTSKTLGEAQAFLLNFFIESQDADQQLNLYAKFKKEQAKDVIVLFNQFSIGELPSGNYNLVVEVKDRSNKLVARKKMFFQRSNPNLPVKAENLAAIDLSRSFVMNIPKDSLPECIRCLGPVSSSSERHFAETQLAVADEDLMRRYFQHFWEKRSALEPESLWVAYAAQVKKVQREYGRMLQKGYETDRGRVYLQYGLPNSVEVRNMDPASYPYEIWHYYKLEATSNAKFIFYNPELVDQRYDLLHSNVPGEPYDPAWHYKLQNLRPKNVDQLMDRNSFDSRATDFWSNPK